MKARINEREIEVAPYSVVGQMAETIGVGGKVSSREFAITLTNMIKENTETLRYIDRGSLTSSDPLAAYLDVRSDQKDNDYREELSEIDKLIEYINNLSEITRDTTKLKTESYFKLIPPVVERYLYIDLPIGYNILSFELKKLKLGLEEEINKSGDAKKPESEYILLFKKRLKVYESLENKLALLIGYINSNKTDFEIKKALYAYLNQDPVFIDFVFRKLPQLYDSLKATLLTTKRGLADEDVTYIVEQEQIILDVKDKIKQALERFENISFSVLNIADDIVDSLDAKNYNYLYAPLDWDVKKEKRARLLGFFDDKKIKNEIIDKLTIETAKIIYKKLVPGTIDLDLQDAKEGDVLKITIELYNASTITGALASIDSDDINESLPPPSKLIFPVANYQIKKTGWKSQISDSFLLVDQLSKNSESSRFQPVPGVSLLLNYGFHGLEKKGLRWLMSLEPSVGVNVSYTDFDDQMDIEFGTGPVIGFFKNRLQTGVSYNLNTDEWFTFVGISFANIARNIKSE